ncbi:MAG: phage BR0599 family protein [Bilophila sp.]
MQDQLPQIVELYEIIADVTHTLTTARQAVSWRGSTWTPAALERSEIRGSVDGKPSTVTLTACMDVLLTRYLAALPVLPTRISIYEHEPASGVTVQIYGGVVMEVVPSADATQVTARCSSASPILDTGVPRMIYSGQCQFVLFDASCGLQAAKWGCTTSVTVSGATLSSPDFAVHPDGFFTRGYVSAASDFRFITSHVGTTLTLQLPFDGRIRNESRVTAFPGCDGSPATCQARFNNSAHFGGCASIPSRNPAVWGFK